MPDLILKPQSTISKFQNDFEGVNVAAKENVAIVSMSPPHGKKKSLSERVFTAFKTELPVVGDSTTSTMTSLRILGMQQDQFFLLFDYKGANAVKEISKKLGDTAYLTDQSDSWVTISVSGPKARTALQQISPVDLHPSVFGKGAVARTMIENLGTIIVCEGADKFLLFSPRSSAESFIYGLETSIRNCHSTDKIRHP